MKLFLAKGIVQGNKMMYIFLRTFSIERDYNIINSHCYTDAIRTQTKYIVWGSNYTPNHYTR